MKEVEVWRLEVGVEWSGKSSSKYLRVEDLQQGLFISEQGGSFECEWRRWPRDRPGPMRLVRLSADDSRSRCNFKPFYFYSPATTKLS